MTGVFLVCNYPFTWFLTCATRPGQFFVYTLFAVFNIAFWLIILIQYGTTQRVGVNNVILRIGSTERIKLARLENDIH